MVNEKAFMAQVVKLAGLMGWCVYHTYDSRRSNPGFPDLLLVRERVLFRELKTDIGRLTPDQLAWIARLKDAKQDVDVWRPRNFDLIADELSRRHLWPAS